MKLENAREILASHRLWRCGGDWPQTDPTKLGLAIAEILAATTAGVGLPAGDYLTFIQPANKRGDPEYVYLTEAAAIQCRHEAADAEGRARSSDANAMAEFQSIHWAVKVRVPALGVTDAKVSAAVLAWVKHPRFPADGNCTLDDMLALMRAALEAAAAA